ncbi:unnamed protein product, partial [Iphiclides podalirius]
MFGAKGAWRRVGGCRPKARGPLSFLEQLVKCTGRRQRRDAEPRDDQPHRHLPHPGAPPGQPLATLLGNVLR